MGVLVLASPGGSPGVTTTALALALTWPRPVMLAECDPSGGSVMAGLWRGESAAGGAALPLRTALSAQRDPAAAAGTLEAETLPLGGGATLLPAPAGPDAGRQLAGAWPSLAQVFTLAEHDIIADIGRWDDSDTLPPLLASASRVLMVCRPTLRQAADAQPRLQTLAYTHPVDGLLVIGGGEYSPGALASQFGIRVAGTLPDAPREASVLSDGAPAPRRYMSSRLMQAARQMAGQLARELDAAATPAPLAEVPRQ